MDTKIWWASKTLWTNIVMIVASILGVFAVDLGFDLSPEGQVQIVVVVMSLVNIALRFWTKTALTSEAT